MYIVQVGMMLRCLTMFFEEQGNSLAEQSRVTMAPTGIHLSKDESTPISRGVSAVFQHVSQALQAVKYSLPDSQMSRPLVETTDKKMRDFVEFTQSQDPARVIYNGLVPFAVSMFEYFFSSLFRVLIAYQSLCFGKAGITQPRVEFATLLQVGNGKRTIEDVIADAYTFQNLGQLNKAYRDWLNIDARAILFKKKRIGNRVAFLENRLEEITQYRHGVVHHFALDQSLTKDGYIAILDAVEASITEFVDFLEKKYKITIEHY